MGRLHLGYIFEDIWTSFNKLQTGLMPSLTGTTEVSQLGLVVSALAKLNSSENESLGMALQCPIRVSAGCGPRVLKAER